MLVERYVRSYRFERICDVQPTVEHRLHTALASFQGGSITATSMSQVPFNRLNHNLLHNIICCIVSSWNIPNNYLAKEGVE